MTNPCINICYLIMYYAVKDHYFWHFNTRTQPTQEQDWDSLYMYICTAVHVVTSKNHLELFDFKLK